MATKKKKKFLSFPAKLLLFGEHIIHEGAKGLAIPLQTFSGQFNYADKPASTFQKKSNESLLDLAKYIAIDDELSKLYNAHELLTDIENGLYFSSNIPQGYGLGSSGTLVAAIAHHFRIQKADKKNSSSIKHELSLIENFFHEKSSGLDPIVSFFNQTVLVENKQVIKIFDLPVLQKEGVRVFILNTHISRKTAPLVKLFLEKTKDSKFQNILHESLLQANDTAVESFLQQKYKSLLTAVNIISQIHFDYFKEFIPQSYHTLWKDGLKNNQFYLKLCGAGGGGFIIGFCKIDFPINEFFSGEDVTEILIR